MKSKSILLFTPAIVAIGVITSCKGGNKPTLKTLTSIVATPAKYIYAVNETFSSNCIDSVEATYDDGTKAFITEGYTCNPEEYTFVGSDVGVGKDITVTYLSKTSTFHINVINSFTNIDVNYDSTHIEYRSENITSIAANNSYKATIKYSSDPFAPFAGVKFLEILDTPATKYTVGINDSTKNVNITGITYENGKGLGSTPAVVQNELKFEGTHWTAYASTIIVYFSTPQAITNSFYVVAK